MINNSLETYDFTAIPHPTGKAPQPKDGNRFLEHYDIEEMYSEGIKHLDEIYLNSDTATLEKEIEYFRYTNDLSLYNRTFYRSSLLSNLLIFLTNRYKEKLSDEFIFDLLYQLNTKVFFKKYIEINKDRLKEYIRNTEFYLFESCNGDNKKFFSTLGCIDVYYFCMEFKNELNLDFAGWEGMFRSFSNQEIYSLILKELECKDKLFDYLIKSKVLIDFLSKNKELDFDITFKLYIEILKENITVVPNYSTKFAELEMAYRNKIKNNLPIKNHDTFTYNFFNKLKILENTPKKLREKHPFYEECYKIFSDIINIRIKGLTEDDIYIVRKLFHRIISEKSLLLISSINTKASFYLYYKTNLFFENRKNIDYKLIDTLSYKQWTDIVNKFRSSEVMAIVMHGHYFGDAISLERYIRMLVFEKTFSDDIPDFLVDFCLEFGYEYTMKYLELKNTVKIDALTHQMAMIINDNSYDKEYKNLLKQFLFEYLNLDDSIDNDLFRYIAIFNYLYENKYPKLNFKTIKLMSTDISPLLFPNNYHIKDVLNKLDFVAKGDPYIEKAKGIVLYNNYRKRIFSSIPNYTNSYNGLDFGTVDMHDINIISNGIGKFIYPKNKLVSSCLTPNGKAASCLEHGALNPNSRFFIVKKDNKTLAYSWMWRSGNILCFDNIELTKDYLELNSNEEYIYYIYMKAAQDIINISKATEENPIKTVILGRNPIDVKNKYFDNCPDVEKKYKALFKPLQSENLYIKDSNEKQVILVDTDEKLMTEDVRPVYLVSRGKVQRLDKDMKKVNSIYFDYCLENCIKYEPLERYDFKSGYIGDDWFYGEKTDGTTVLFEIFNDDRRKEEIKQYVTGFKTNNYQINISKNKIDRLNYLLDSNNYIYNLNELKEYLKSIQTYMEVSKDEFFHSPHSIDIYTKILLSGKISSYYDRGLDRSGGNNGKYFISVAQMYSAAYTSYNGNLGFLFHKDILAFNTKNSLFVQTDKIDFLRSSDYYIRPSGVDGESQVYGSIPLDKVKAIMIPEMNIDLGKTVYINEECDFDFPIIHTESKKIFDNEEVKRLIKIK